MEPIDQALVADIAAALRRARRVAVVTGAGMSADSGLPTYRGIGGLYNDIELEENLAIEDILHAYTLARNPALTWKYIAQIERACRGAAPHAGHHVLAQWDQRFELWIMTQHVDGFHHAAGSRHVIELHGNLRELYCIDCRALFAITDFDLQQLPPRCRHCDGLVRPTVVLFGELLPATAIANYERELARGFDLMFAIGTTAGFPYIQQPFVAAAARQCMTVEINPDRTPLSSVVSHHLGTTALSALTALAAALSTP